MSYILRFLRLLWQILVIGPYIFLCWLFYLLPYSKHPEKYPIEKRYRKIRRLIRVVLKVFCVQINVTGYREVKRIKGRFELMPNHRSFMDPLLMIAVSEKPLSFAAKKETEKYPIIGRAIKALQGVFLDREDLRQQLQMVRYIESETINNPNRQWVIFPEGTRQKEGSVFNLLDFHPGSFRTPFNEKVPVFPVAIFGSDRVLSKKYMYRVPVQVVFGSPILPDEKNKIENSSDFALYTHRVIMDLLATAIKRDPVYQKQLIKEEKKKQRAKKNISEWRY